MRTGVWVATLLALGSLSVPDVSWASAFRVDAEHTSVAFRVRHLFTQVQGRFDRFEGKIRFDPTHPEKTTVEGTVDVASINTNVKERDEDLRSKRFFDVEHYPKITFVSTGVTNIDAGMKTAKLHGILTMHGVEKPVVMDVSYYGAGADPWGNRRAGFSARTTISRTDFGLSWNETLETGGLLVGDDVQIEIQVEGLAEE